MLRSRFFHRSPSVHACSASLLAVVLSPRVRRLDNSRRHLPRLDEQDGRRLHHRRRLQPDLRTISAGDTVAGTSPAAPTARVTTCASIPRIASTPADINVLKTGICDARLHHRAAPSHYVCDVHPGMNARDHRSVARHSLGVALSRHAEHRRRPRREDEPEVRIPQTVLHDLGRACRGSRSSP